MANPIATAHAQRTYIVKLSSLLVVTAVKATSNFVHDGIYNFSSEIKVDDPVFIYFSGDKTKISWEQGIAAVGRISRAPYDFGYDTANPRYFRIEIEPLHLLSSPIPPKEGKLHDSLRYELYEVPYVGANHFPNQAIGEAKTPNQRNALAALYLEYDHSAKSVLEGLGLQPDLANHYGSYDDDEEVEESEDPVREPDELTPEEQGMRDLLLRYKQVIFYGPPGTGKSFHARRIASNFDVSATTVFHPSYGYEDFVGGIRPELADAAFPSADAEEGSTPQLGFRVVEHTGVFLSMCRRANDETGKNFVLILDEINRGDIARIFGELIYAIESDKRGKAEVQLSYLSEETRRKNPLSVPSNLYLIGTMNSSDRSIALLDVALRRRFAFVEIEPDTSPLARAEVDTVRLDFLLDRLNYLLLAYRDRDHRVGQAYLLQPDTGKPLTASAELHSAWYGRIMPLLEEYFYSNPQNLHAMLGDGFITRTELEISSDSLEEMPVDYAVRRYPMSQDGLAEFISNLTAFTQGPPNPSPAVPAVPVVTAVAVPVPAASGTPATTAGMTLFDGTDPDAGDD